MFFGFTTEFVLCIFLAYCRPINYAFGTRDVVFLHFGMYAFFFSTVIVVYDEIRKYLIRNYPPKDKPNWFQKNTLT